MNRFSLNPLPVSNFMVQPWPVLMSVNIAGDVERKIAANFASDGIESDDPKQSLG